MMIRKAIIVALTLAAVGTAIASIICVPNRLYIWDINAQQAVGVTLSIRGLTLLYFRVGDGSEPDIRGYWGGLGYSRGHLYTQPENVYSGTTYAVGCPSWLPVVVFGAYPTIAFIRGPVRRSRRRKQGLCLKPEKLISLPFG